MKFTPSQHFDKLTVIIVARNVTALHYTFIESLWSAIPLGCRFLVGDFQSDDQTSDYYHELAKHVPMQIITRPWAGTSGLTAIGLATQELINAAETEFVYNLQANEVLCEDTPRTIFDFLESPERNALIPQMHFRHFFGNCRFEATIGGHAYNFAQRLMDKAADTSQGDGCQPIINPNRDNRVNLGTVHRYSYCFRNQVKEKVLNHAKYFGSPIQSQYDNIEWCRHRPNYDGPHPACVQHMIHNENYDMVDSLRKFKEVWEML